MSNVRLVALLCVALCAGCATNAQRQAEATPSASMETPASQEPLEASAQAIITAYALQTERARGASIGASPSVDMRNTPALVSFDFSTNRITIPTWDDQPVPVKSVFQQFSGGDESATRQFFQAFFNRFLIAHEASHWLQYKTWNGAPPQMYLLEQDANILAVAFWRTQPGGEEFLAQLEQLATAAYQAVPDPTPAGQDAATYFGKNYEQLGSDPVKYGYYQFRFMSEALKNRSQLDFAKIASRPTSSNEVLGVTAK